MKLNWGTSIAIFYSLFVVVMVFMVFKSTQNKMDMVQENYYDMDLNYEDFRTKRQNSVAISDKIIVKYSVDSKAIELSFPEDMKNLSGELTLFRPSNKTLDQSFELSLDEQAKMSIPVDHKIPDGLWKIQLDWKNGDKSYFKETVIVI